MIIYEHAGKWGLMEQAARATVRNDPVGIPGYSWLSFLYTSLGRLDEAQEVIDTELIIAPDSEVTLGNKADLLAQQGQIEAALNLLEEHKIQRSGWAIFVYAAAGRKDDIRRTMKALERKVWIVHAHALLGNFDGLLHALQGAIDDHDPMLFQLAADGPYHKRLNIDGVRLGAIYDRQEVQMLLQKINMDRISSSGLKI